MSDLANYLTQMAEARRMLLETSKLEGEINSYASIEEFVVKFGREMVLPEKYPDWYEKLEPNMCYSNSFRLMAERGLTYCEGYGSGVIPTLHGWVLDEDGFVIDSTWVRNEENPQTYFGIPFTARYVMECGMDDDGFCVIDRWWKGFPLLSMENPHEVIKK